MTLRPDIDPAALGSPESCPSRDPSTRSRRQLLKGAAGTMAAASLAIAGRARAQDATPQAPPQENRSSEHGTPVSASPLAGLQPGDPTDFTVSANQAVLSQLAFDDATQFDLAQKGLIELTQDVLIPGPGLLPVWNLQAYGFLNDDAPDSANPSLWRHAQLNMVAGLFEVMEGIYQVRGYDLSNITFIETNNGVIVVDPLASMETAKAAMELFYKHRPNNPVIAVIHTHSHVDHFGGVKGIVDVQDVANGNVRIIAPDGFLKEAVSENVFAGNAMVRRASYMYGAILPGPDGQIDAGDGKRVSNGTVSLIAPTDVVRQTGDTLVVDGVQIEFQLTPDTEAPSEMNFYLPQFRALCAAENAVPLVHNLYTLRGAQVRDAKAWAFYLNQMLALYGDKSDVMFCQHLWPRWGQNEIVQFVGKLADMYKYIHDQTLRLANQGLTMIEIAEQVQLPNALANDFDFRGYYGTVNQNVKAVYQRYMGWFDANPAHLHRYPPEEAASRYVRFMGGAESVLANARQSFDEGDYRWVAEVVNHLVFDDPSNADAKELLAHAYEQLGYQAESGPWRNFYLTGAAELRRGVPAMLPAPTLIGPDVASAMTPDLLFDYMAVRVDGPAAMGLELTFLIQMSESNDTWLLRLRNAALSAMADPAAAVQTDASVTLSHAALVSLALSEASIDDLISSGDLQIDGDAGALRQLVGLLDTFDFWFNIVTP